MKLAICGSRTFWFQTHQIQEYLDECNLHPDEIVSGGAMGVDKSAENYAHDKCIIFTKFPAAWGNHGKAAGPMRNKEIAEYADELLLIWNGKSKGSANMKQCMLDAKKKVHEIILEKK